MRWSVVVAVLAQLVASPLSAQDLSTATSIAGTWTYAATADGSEARFANVSGNPQLVVHCARAGRRVTISRPASAAAPFLNVWTSSLERSVASSFSPATGQLTIDLANFDPLLDAIASSRGRIGFTAGAQPPLIVPSWAEPARVIEDCRV